MLEFREVFSEHLAPEKDSGGQPPSPWFLPRHPAQFFWYRVICCFLPTQFYFLLKSFALDTKGPVEKESLLLLDFSWETRAGVFLEANGNEANNS